MLWKFNCPTIMTAPRSIQISFKISWHTLQRYRMQTCRIRLPSDYYKLFYHASNLLQPIVSQNWRHVKLYFESMENAYYRINKGCRLDIVVIKSVTDEQRTQRWFVNYLGGLVCGLTPTKSHKVYKPTLGPKYVTKSL